MRPNIPEFVVLQLLHLQHENPASLKLKERRKTNFRLTRTKADFKILSYLGFGYLCGQPEDCNTKHLLAYLAGKKTM